MSATSPRLSFLVRSGVTYVGLETADLDVPSGLRYPARAEIVWTMVPSRIQGQGEMQARVLPVALPFPLLPLEPGEKLIPLGADDGDYSIASEFLAMYLALVEKIKTMTAQGGKPRLFSGR